MADFMQQAAQGAVKKNLGPDPTMKAKVDLLNRLVAMKRDMARKGPVAKGQPVPRDPMASGRPRTPGVPTRLPRRDQMPAQFAGRPGYNFGPPGGM